jgi:hypothetical protein
MTLDNQGPKVVLVNIECKEQPRLASDQLFVTERRAKK